MSVLQPETGIFYGICWLVVILRLASRRLHRGAWKRLQLDDYLIIAAMLTDTVLIAVMTRVVVTSSNLIEPGQDVSNYTTAEIDSRIFGSKLVLVVEQMQIATIWLIKACLLIMYNRMTTVLPQHKIVVGTAIYVAVAFYWAVPPNSKQCSAATNHLITNAVFNISSDLIILSIPMPLLFRVRLPKKNKVILVSVFLIGAFTIVAAVLNKYYSFTNPFGTQWTIWYLRESYTAILCANLPLIYPLIQKVFRLQNWNPTSYTADANRLHRGPTAQSAQPIYAGSRPQPAHRSVRGTMRRTESQEIMGYSADEEGEHGPHFITSAIDMDDLKSPTNSSMDSPAGWKQREDMKKETDPYHVV
ncbi:hypothetical protein CC86DRAFT_390949 [Ophiobolus disseminans]|uniref:Rhodopsin domain-containing protein n=1 Tax=Ophiobolus disseminans TaxID=1469910 RepID=A0A6A7ADK2_9PLEO|nr:hypothetical protein CC86DRAFT_390949 [Ophiobolus disseminans]